MRFLIFFFLLLGTCHLLLAQKLTSKSSSGTLIGEVTDSLTAKPLAYAMIAVLKEGKPVNGSLTDQNGNFRISNLPDGVYTLSVKYLGYKDFSIAGIRVKEANVHNVGNLHLSSDNARLKGVTIVSKQNTIENRIDMIVYHADKDITSQSGVATDVLRKVPMVSVDVDGNVSIEGNSSIRVLINGKPSTMFGSNLTEALQSIPASQIKAVEVITLPGAKYDAQGSGGILNIILKNNKAKGWSGNINGTLGSRLENGGIQLNYHKNNFGVNASFDGHSMLKSSTISTLGRHDFDSSGAPLDHMLQAGQGNITRGGYDVRMGFNWDITPNDNLTGSMDYDHFSMHSNNTMDQTIHYLTKPISSSLYQHRISGNVYGEHSSEYDLAYQHKFKRKGQELDALATYNPGHHTMNYFLQPFDSGGNIMNGAARSFNPGTDNESIFSVDYTQPVSKVTTLEAGVKGTFDYVASKTDYYGLVTGSNSYVQDPFRSQQFNYHQSVLAGYVSAITNLLHFLDMEAGVRYEATELKSTFSAGNPVIFPNYSTFVPSLIFSHTFKQHQMLKLGYSKRIERPEFRDLNPAINASDPTNIQVGNPSLGPEIHDRIELGYSFYIRKKAMTNITLYYNHSAHDIQPYTCFFPFYTVGDTTYKNVAVSTRENIGTEKNIGFNIFSSYSLNNKLDFRTNIFVFDKYITNRFVSGNHRNSLDYRINLNVSYQWSPKYEGEFFGMFHSKRNEVQGYYPSFYYYTLAFKRLLFNNKGSIGISLANFFTKYLDQTENITGPFFSYQSKRLIPYRSVGITFSYRFGKMDDKEDSHGKQQAGTREL